MDAETNRLRRRIDETLTRFLAEERRRLENLDSSAPLLLDAVSRVVESGGKRLRPLLCYWGHLAGGGRDSEAIVAAAASLELLHTFALIHDDVMDSSSERRGQPTLQVWAAERFKRHGGGERAEHLGVSVAVLAGDLALVLSDSLFWRSGFEPEVLANASEALSEMRAAAAGGQFLDLIRPAPEVNPEEALRIAALKTGAYSIKGPLMVGAALASAGEEVASTLGAFGLSLGQAFQLRDDVLSLFGDPARTGKDWGADVRGGRPTYLVSQALARADSPGRAAILGAYGDPEATAEAVEAAISAVRAAGALEVTQELIASLLLEAKRVLEEKRARLAPGAAEGLARLAELAVPSV